MWHFHTVFGLDRHCAQKIIKCKRWSCLQVSETDLHQMCVFILLISPNHILFSILFYCTPLSLFLPLSLCLSLSFPFVVIDGVRQQSTEQRVANSPRQPASEGEGERLVRRRVGFKTGLKKKKGKGNESVKGRMGGRVWEKERGAQLKATDLILCIIKQSHSMQHPLYIIHAQ